MRAFLAIFLGAAAWAQLPSPSASSTQPVRVNAECTEEEVQSLGLGCTAASPCPVYLELSGVETAANRIFVVGNLHTETATLASVLLASEDGGLTWSEPHPRIKSGSFELASFFDLQTGWISGQITGALARDPFFLLTNDGGKSWRQRPVLQESGPGMVEQFSFDTATTGSVIVDRAAGAEGGRYALLETRTGGESWMIRSVGRDKPTLSVRPHTTTAWRLQPHAATKSYRLERKDAGGKWSAVSSFPVAAGQCKPGDTLLQPPPSEEEKSTSNADAVEVFQVGTPKNGKPATPKKKR